MGTSVYNVYVWTRGKGAACKPDNLSLIPWTHMKKGASGPTPTVVH